MSRNAPHLNPSIKQLHEFAVELARITVSGTWRDSVKAAGASQFFVDDVPHCIACGHQTGGPRNAAEEALLAIGHLQSELDAAKLLAAREAAGADA